MRQFIADCQWPDDFIYRVLDTAKAIAITSIMGTSVISFAAGFYGDNRLDSFPGSVAPHVVEIFNFAKTSVPKPDRPEKASLSIDLNTLDRFEDSGLHDQSSRLREETYTAIGRLTEQPLRPEWRQAFDEFFETGEELSLSVRQNLGRYSEQDMQRLAVQAEAVGLSKNRLQRRVNARINQFFPAVKNANFSEVEGDKRSPLFQIWCAIVQEEVENLQEI